MKKFFTFFILLVMVVQGTPLNQCFAKAVASASFAEEEVSKPDMKKNVKEFFCTAATYTVSVEKTYTAHVHPVSKPVSVSLPTITPPPDFVC